MILYINLRTRDFEQVLRLQPHFTQGLVHANQKNGAVCPY